MNNSDRAEIREMLSDVLTGKLEAVHIELKAIKEQTTRTNGRVTTLESKCESMKDDVVELEKSDVSRKSGLKTIGITAGVASAVATLIVSVLTLLLK